MRGQWGPNLGEIGRWNEIRANPVGPASRRVGPSGPYFRGVMDSKQKDMIVVDALWDQIIRCMGASPDSAVVIVSAFNVVGWTLGKAMKVWKRRRGL